MNSKKILDVTCGARSIWFNKHHPAAVYCDKRQVEEHSVFGKTQRKRDNIIIPDVLCDFTDLPFPDDSFALVVMDPPPYCKSKRDGMVG